MTGDVPSRDIPAYQRPSPAGRVGRRRWGCVCSVVFAVVVLLPFIWCQKMDADVLGVMPGAVWVPSVLDAHLARAIPELPGGKQQDFLPEHQLGAAEASWPHAQPQFIHQDLANLCPCCFVLPFTHSLFLPFSMGFACGEVPPTPC